MAAAIEFTAGGPASPKRIVVDIGTVVTAANADDTGILGWKWELLDRPASSAAVLSAAFDPTTDITGDERGGGYLIQLTTYLDAARTIVDSVSRGIVLIPFKGSYDWRIPAAGETTEDDATRGWAETMESILRQTQARLQGEHDRKDAVRAATDNVLGGASYNAANGEGGTGQFTAAPAAVDSIVVATGDRLLVKDQADPKQNGIYVVTGDTTIWDRASDFDADDDVTSGADVQVVLGTANTGTTWHIQTQDPITLNTTSIVFAQSAGGAGAGGGLLLGDIRTSNDTALIGEMVPVRTPSGAFTITAPTPVDDGDSFGVTYLSLGNFGSPHPERVTINGGGVSVGGDFSDTETDDVYIYGGVMIFAWNQAADKWIIVGGGPVQAAPNFGTGGSFECEYHEHGRTPTNVTLTALSWAPVDIGRALRFQAWITAKRFDIPAAMTNQYAVFHIDATFDADASSGALTEILQQYLVTEIDPTNMVGVDAEFVISGASVHLDVTGLETEGILWDIRVRITDSSADGDVA